MKIQANRQQVNSQALRHNAQIEVMRKAKDTNAVLSKNLIANAQKNSDRLQQMEQNNLKNVEVAKQVAQTLQRGSRFDSYA